MKIGLLDGKLLLANDKLHLVDDVAEEECCCLPSSYKPVQACCSPNATIGYIHPDDYATVADFSFAIDGICYAVGGEIMSEPIGLTRMTPIEASCLSQSEAFDGCGFGSPPECVDLYFGVDITGPGIECNGFIKVDNPADYMYYFISTDGSEDRCGEAPTWVDINNVGWLCDGGNVVSISYGTGGQHFKDKNCSGGAGLSPICDYQMEDFTWLGEGESPPETC